MKRAYVKYIAGLLLFGFNGIVSEQISLSSYDIVFYRTLFGGLLLCILCCFSKEHIAIKQNKPELAAVIFSFLLLHETFTPSELAGTILILIGALASEIHRESKSFTSSSET